MQKIRDTKNTVLNGLKKHTVYEPCPKMRNIIRLGFFLIVGLLGYGSAAVVKPSEDGNDVNIIVR